MMFQVDPSLGNHLHDWMMKSSSNLCLVLSYSEESSSLFSLAKDITKTENLPSHLQSLTLERVYVNHGLQSLIKNCDHLKSLELKECSLGNEGAKSISESLKLNHSLQHLNLERKFYSNYLI